MISGQEATIMAVGNKLDRPCEGMRLKSNFLHHFHCMNTILFVEVYAIISDGCASPFKQFGPSSPFAFQAISP